MRHLMQLLAATALVLSTGAAYADLGDQLFKLLPDDGEAGDVFGRYVAISGATAIVGAWLDDDNGTSSGAAYLFDTTTGQQIAKLLPEDGAAGDWFGTSVAISGTTIIVGSRFSAYLFDTTTGQQLFKLLPDDGAEGVGFGQTVAISCTTAIVGAYADDDNGTQSGSAYLFDTTTGQQIAKLLPKDGEAGDWFGLPVAISGTTVIVGAHGDDDNGIDSGSAYLFDATTAQQIGKLLPDDGAATDNFGNSVWISGITAIIGADGDNDNGLDSGSAYLFDTTTGQQIAKLLPNDGAPQDFFGRSVAISGDTAIIGAGWHYDNGTISGAAYLFNTTTGQQIAELLPDDGAELDIFGISVAISGAIVIVGSVLDDDSGTDSGSAYLFDAAACPWDLNGDGAVGPFDLASVLGFWGPNPGHPADLDGDCKVGPLDLAILLGAWGPCP